MENASKALIIAGGVLIAMVVISLLVVFYGNIQEWAGANRSVDVAEQVEEFNKPYDVYYRDNIYGSELLSLVNKVVDYNNKYFTKDEADGYSKLEMEITFTKDIIAYGGEKVIRKDEKFTSQQLSDKIKELEDNIENYGNIQVPAAGNRKISALSGVRTSDLKQMMGIDPLDSHSSVPTDVQNNIDMYLGYKTALTNVKSKVFSAKNFKYNKTNGRIELMEFKQND